MTWSAEDLATFGDPHEVRITAIREDGGESTTVPIWIVRVRDELYVRSWKGERGAWYRHARVTGRARIDADGASVDVRLNSTGAEDHAVEDAVDAAFLDQYSHSPYAGEMVAEPARSTTMRLERA